MIKVLYLPLAFGTIRGIEVANAFTQVGCQVEIFDYMLKFEELAKDRTKVRQQLVQKIRSFQPNLVLLQLQHQGIIDGETLFQIKRAFPKIILVNYTIDIRTRVEKSYLDAARIADFNLICSTGQTKMYEKALGKKVHYWQIGYSPSLYYPAIDEKEPEFTCCFIAHYNPTEDYPGRQERINTVGALRLAFGGHLALFGDLWPEKITYKNQQIETKSLGGIDINVCGQAYSKSLCVISVSHFNSVSHYFSDRLLLCLASGKPTIVWKFPGIESFLTDKGDCLYAESPEEIVEKVQWCLDNPEYASLIGNNGSNAAYHENTYLSRAKQLLHMVGLQGA